MSDKTIGDLITRWRKLRGLSQSELQRRAKLSAPSIISRAEKGTLPTPENMRAIARAVGAEFSIMEAYERAVGQKSRASPTEFHVASTQCLLAAPLALLETQDVVMSTTRAAEPGDPESDEGAGPDASYVPLTCEVMEDLLDDGSANAILRYRRRSAAGTHRVVATLHCEFSSDGVDVLGAGDGPELPATSLSSVLDEPDATRLEADGDEAKMLVESRQLPAELFRAGAARRGARGRAATLSMEPFTSRRLRGKPYSPPRGEARRTLTAQLDLVVPSEYDFRSSHQMLATMLERLHACAQEVSVRSEDPSRLAISPASLRQVARVFDTTPEVVQAFFLRAEPDWQLSLAPIWLPRARGAH